MQRHVVAVFALIALLRQPRDAAVTRQALPVYHGGWPAGTASAALVRQEAYCGTMLNTLMTQQGCHYADAALTACCALALQHDLWYAHCSYSTTDPKTLLLLLLLTTCTRRCERAQRWIYVSTPGSMM
jgi:hypothetical protein